MNRSTGILYVDWETTEVMTTRTEYGDRSRLLWEMRAADTAYRTGTDAETQLWRDGLNRAFHAVTQHIRVLFDPDNEDSQLWPRGSHALHQPSGAPPAPAAAERCRGGD